MESNGLGSIKAPVQKELKAFESYFRKSMSSQVPLLDKITYYIVQRKGKQIRPMFVFLCAKLFGEVNNSTYTAASLIELLHTATLVHDDVVDDANKRRGFFSINALWKNKIAVLVGDYLLSKGLLLAIDNDEFKLLHIVSTAVKEMSEGELLQIEKARRLDIDEQIYFDIIRQKTASLIAAACGAGAFSTSKDEAILDRIIAFGTKVGICFQIKDDLFDYGTNDVGKPLGIDIKEKKMTLPLIHALKTASKSEIRWVKNSIKRHNEDKKRVKEIIEFVKSRGGIQYAEESMLKYRKEALDILLEFPDNDARTALKDLVHFVTDRKH
jgi:octaprenyl-diphosphate synthase